MSKTHSLLDRLSRRTYVLGAIGVAAIFGIAAAEPDSALSLDNLKRICIRGSDGKPAIEGSQDGNLKIRNDVSVGGKLTIQGDIDVATELKKCRDEIVRLQQETAKNKAARPAQRVLIGTAELNHTSVPGWTAAMLNHSPPDGSGRTVYVDVPFGEKVPEGTRVVAGLTQIDAQRIGTQVAVRVVKVRETDFQVEITTYHKCDLYHAHFSWVAVTP